MHTYRSDNEFTTFNRWKIFTHFERWKKIKQEHPLPPPVLVTVDPSNICNLNCSWCNAKISIKNNKMISKSKLVEIANLLGSWSVKGYKTKAVCIAGGGEPLLHPELTEFYNKLNENELRVATTTNGIYINRYYNELLNNEFVAVSVDAGTRNTYNACKGLAKDDLSFDVCLENIERLCSMHKEKNCNLKLHGVAYRMVLVPENIKDIYTAAVLAKKLGCKTFHVRPAGTPYDKSVNINFSKNDAEIVLEQIRQAKQLESDSFKVHYSGHKFDKKLQKCNNFSKCFAVFMTATIMPSNLGRDGFSLNVCCDRRGDAAMNLLSNEQDAFKIISAWGSDKHWNIHRNLDSDTIKNICPRCTYYDHNMFYEKVIFDVDNLLVDFI